MPPDVDDHAGVAVEQPQLVVVARHQQWPTDVPPSVARVATDGPAQPLLRLGRPVRDAVGALAVAAEDLVLPKPLEGLPAVASARRLVERGAGGDHVGANPPRRGRAPRRTRCARAPRSSDVEDRGRADRSADAGLRRRRRGSQRRSAVPPRRSQPHHAPQLRSCTLHGRWTRSPSTAPASMDASWSGSPTRTSRARGRSASTSRDIIVSETIDASSTTTTSKGSRFSRS